MKKIILAIIFSTAAFISCSENSTIPNALRYEFSEISNLPGYGWFNEEFEAYVIDSSKIDLIRQTYNPSVHKFLMFTRPSCTCPGAHKRFPAVFKVLQAADIPLASMEFYSFSSTQSKHPYDSLITVSSLPAFIIMKSGQPIYSIADTMNFNTYYQIAYPNTFEDIIYEGLKK